MTRTAREYLRVSKGTKGQERSTDDQHADNVVAAEEFAFTLGESYIDRGSASRYAIKVRDGFDQLTDDLRSGAFGADVLILWESSRGSREMAEWTALIDLCERHGIKIHVTSHEQTYDPSNYRHREQLLSDGVNSDTETRRLSHRVRRGTTSAAAGGRPHGETPFGYERTYRMIKGTMRPDQQLAHPVEGPLVVSLFQRIKDGDSFKAVERDWAAAGVVGRRGSPFSHATLRSMITNPLYKGVRVHNGEETKASWEGLVSADLWEAVQVIVKDPTRRTRTSNGVKHTFTMIMRCDVCGGPITVNKRNRGGRRVSDSYDCQDKSCIMINKAEVDAIVEGVIIAYLSRGDVGASLGDATDGQSELRTVRDDLAREHQGLRELEAATPASLAEARMIAKAVTAKEAVIADLEAAERSLSRPDVLSGLFPPGGDVAARWAATQVGGRRQIASLLLTPGILGQVRITRTPSGQAVPAVDRLVWRTEES